MRARTLPLTRRLGPLEVLGAAVWFARDHAATWLLTGPVVGFALALALASYRNFLADEAPRMHAGRQMAGVLAWSAALAALVLARGLGHWALTEAIRAQVQGAPLAADACWLAALRRAPRAMFFAGCGSLAMTAGLIAGVYPGLRVSSRIGTALPAAVFEGLPPGRALSRARELIAGSLDGAAVWALLLLAWAVLFGNALLLGAVGPSLARSLLGLSFPRIEAVLSPENPTWIVLSLGLTWALCDGLRAVANVVLYMNSRIEREGTDLLARVEEMRAAEEPAPAREAAHA